MKYIDVGLHLLEAHPIMAIVMVLSVIAIVLMVLNAEVELAEVEYREEEE